MARSDVSYCPGGLAGAVPGDVGPKRWRREAALRETLRVSVTSVRDMQLSDRVVRGSSLVENLDSRARSYFFLRRQ